MFDVPSLLPQRSDALSFHPQRSQQMCTETLSTFTTCPCRMRRITPCKAHRRKEERACQHLERFYEALEVDEMLGCIDPRTCKKFRSVEEVVVGTCEMGRGGGCIYVQGNLRLDDEVRAPGDGTGWWSPDEI